MNNISGPFDREDWLTLLQLKESIQDLKTRNVSGKFDRAIKKETRIYKSILKVA